MYNQITSNKRKSFLLLLISVAVLALLGFVFGEASGYGYQVAVPIALFAVFLNLGSYFAGDKLALASAHAKPITKEQSPYVYRMVENLCITAGIPMPKIHIIEDESMNAFATGRKPDTASIALTTGIVNTLENEELEGVIAHELSHIKNYDIRFMTLIVMSVGAIIMLADVFMRGALWGGMRRDNKNGGGALMIIGLVLAILSPLIAQLIKFAISRKREYLADASGALLTRYPDGLASALEKIGAQARPLKNASKATAHLCIANPFLGGGKRVTNLFQTHPPLEDRIRILRGMTL